MKKRSQAISDSSDEEKLIGTLPRMALLPGGRPIKVATPRVFVPRGVCPPATGHWSSDHRSTSCRPFAQWTRRHHRTAVTGHWSNGHYTRIFKSVNHRSPAIQPPVIGLENINTGEVNIHRSTGHWSSEFISTYI